MTYELYLTQHTNVQQDNMLVTVKRVPITLSNCGIYLKFVKHDIAN